MSPLQPRNSKGQGSQGANNPMGFFDKEMLSFLSVRTCSSRASMVMAVMQQQPEDGDFSPASVPSDAIPHFMRSEEGSSPATLTVTVTVTVTNTNTNTTATHTLSDFAPLPPPPLPTLSPSPPAPFVFGRPETKGLLPVRGVVHICAQTGGGR